MGVPYLERGESIILTTDRVSVDSVVYDAMLTNRRLILIDNRHARSEPRITALATIESVRSGRAATGEPVIILALQEDEETGAESRVIIFLQQPLENRREDRDLWVMKFIELSVFCREKRPHGEEAAVARRGGMQPSVRHWVAPETIRPRTEIVRPKILMPEMVITPEEPGPAGRPEPEVSPAGKPAAGSDERVTESGNDKHEFLARATQAAVQSITTHDQIKSSAQQGEIIEDISLPIRRGTSVVDENRVPPQPITETPSSLSRSILAATKAMIAEKAKEELALPPRPVIVRTTSRLPDMPAPQPMAAPEVVTQPDSAGTPELLEYAEVQASIRSTSLPLEIHDVQTETEPTLSDSLPEQFSKGREERPLNVPTGPPAAPVQEQVTQPGTSITAGTGIGSLLMPVVVITILLVILSVFIVVNGTLPYETIPLVIVPTPTPAMTPSITTVPTQPPVTNEGVWVRIVSEEGYTGQAGNPEFLEKVSGSGERFFKVHDSSDLVKVAVTKLRNSGSKLTVEIIRDGKTIASRSTTAPMGSVDLLIDPATGAAPGMTTTTPAAETTGAGHLEYL